MIRFITDSLLIIGQGTTGYKSEFKGTIIKAS